MTAEPGMFGCGESLLRPSSTHDRPTMTAHEAWTALCLKIKTLFSSVEDPHALTEYDEPVFRALFGLEQQRSLQSGRAFHALSCTISSLDGTPITMNGAVTALMLSTLRAALRKTDHVGWFLQNRTLGVLLTCIEPGTATISSRRAMDRIRRTLTDTLSVHDPSLVLQLYDELQLPTPEQPHATQPPPHALVQQN